MAWSPDGRTILVAERGSDESGYNGDPDRVGDRRAAEALKLTAPHLRELGVIDSIIPEPLGGAHMDWDGAAAALKKAVLDAFASLEGLATADLLEARYQKFARMGSFEA